MLIDGTKRNQEEQNPMIGGQPSSNITGTSNVGQTGSRGGTASGGFTNLNKYLQANQGANNQTINKLSNTAQQSAGQAQQAINQAKDIGTSAQQNLDQFQNDQQFVSQALANPLQSPDISRFNRLRTGFNASPAQQQQKFDTATAEANTVRSQKANELQNLTTSGGLTDWLRSQRQSPRYSQGSQSLDRFLIKGTDEGSQALQNIGQKAQSLQAEPGEFNTIRQGIQSRAQSLNPNMMTSEQIANAASQRLAQERQALLDYQNRDATFQVVADPTPTQPTEYDPFAGWNVSVGMPGGGNTVSSGTGDVVLNVTPELEVGSLTDYLRMNDSSPNVSRFTPEQIMAYRTLASMSGQEPSDILTQNEQLYQAKLQRRNQLADQYGQLRASAASEVAADRAAQAEAERKRQDQIRQIAAIIMGASGGGGASNSLNYNPPAMDWLASLQ
jgi:hypothetical protein